MEAAAAVEHVDDLAPHLGSDDCLPASGVKYLGRQVGASVEEEFHLPIVRVRHALGTVGRLPESEVCDLTQVEVIGVREVEAIAEGIFTEPWQLETFGNAHEHCLEADRVLLPEDGGGLRDRGDDRLPDGLNLVGFSHVGSLEFPSFQKTQVGEDVVGVHRRRPDQDVIGDEERELLEVSQDLDVGLTGGQGVGRRAHVEN